MKTLKDLNLQDITFRGCANEELFQQNIFINALNTIDKENPTMIELGACDAYYSLIFNKFFSDKNVKNYCIEISKEFLEIGKRNALNNDCKNIEFINAGIGEINKTSVHVLCDGMDTVDMYTLSDFIKNKNIDFIDVLHMDIQGTEISVLEDITRNDLFKKIRYSFISTHHQDGIFGPSYHACHKILENVSKKIHFTDEHNGGVGDGLIVVEFN